MQKCRNVEKTNLGYLTIAPRTDHDISTAMRRKKKICTSTSLNVHCRTTNRGVVCKTVKYILSRPSLISLWLIRSLKKRPFVTSVRSAFPAGATRLSENRVPVKQTNYLDGDGDFHTQSRGILTRAYTKDGNFYVKT